MISLLNVPICTQGVQRTWWPEAGTIIVIGPYLRAPRQALFLKRPIFWSLPLCIEKWGHLWIILLASQELVEYNCIDCANSTCGSWRWVSVMCHSPGLQIYNTLPLLQHSHKQARLPLFDNVMMTSSNGNIFCVTGHLCWEITSLQWIPHTKASDVERWCFLWSASE